MIQCPDCRSMIPDDSAFCDQCGKELRWCPICKKPKRGTECPVCGSDLVNGTVYMAGAGSPVAGGQKQSAQVSQQNVQQNSPQQNVTPPQSKPQGTPQNPVSATGQRQQATSAKPQGTAASGPMPLSLVGNGWTLPLREGTFGRNGGIWPQLGSSPYVSGSHGKIISSPSGWLVCDNGSTNGTRLNGHPLSAGVAAPLNCGDRLRIATLEFTVQ